MLTFNGIMQVLTQVALIKPLASRLGERRLLLLGQIMLAVAMFGLAAVSNPLVATALFAPFAFGYGVSEPSLQALATRFGPRQTRGFLLGLYQSARSLALIVGPIAAGYIYQNIGPRVVFSSAGAVMLAAILVALSLMRLDVKPIEL
jgi:MFS family permease